MKRILIALAAIAVLGIGGFLVYREWRARNTQSAESQWQVIPVNRGTIQATVSATGVLQAQKQVMLNFKSAGRLKRLYVKKGQVVKQGDLLAELDAEDIKLQVKQAEVALQIAQDRLSLAKKKATSEDLAAAEAGVKSAKENLGRVKQGPSEKQLSAAQASLSAAEANYNKLASGPTDEALLRAKLAVDQAKNSLWGAQNSRDSLGLSIQFGGPRSQYDQAQAQVLNAEIAVELAEINYRELQKGPDQGQLDAARAQWEQARESYQSLKDSPRASDLALAESQLAQAEASLARVRNGASSEEIRVTEGQVKQAQVSLEQAQLLLDGAAIRAPFDGVIGVANGEEGALVSVAAPFISLVNVSAFRIEVNVDEVDIVAIREGQPILLTLDALPEQKITGRVTAVSPMPTTDVGIVSYAVAIEIEPTDAPLRVGMSATAEITTQSKEGVLLIPNRAIRIDRENGDFHVEKLINGQPVDVEVTLGVRNEFYSEIVKGLEAGDEVIIRTQTLREQISSSFMTP